MTFGHVVDSPRLQARRRLALLIPLLVGLVVGVVFWRAGERRRRAHPPAATAVVRECTFVPPPVVVDPEPPPPPPEPVLRPTFAHWMALDRCLREEPVGPPHRPAITREDVAGWISEGDRFWYDSGLWWFPMSGEGDAQMPSGYYLGVPDDGSRCHGAIMN